MRLSKISLLFCILLLSIITGCSMNENSLRTRIIEADPQMVINYEFLGDVNGSSGWGNLMQSVGIKNAKKEAINQAAELGATHIVWVQISGGYCPYVHGRAYRRK